MPPDLGASTRTVSTQRPRPTAATVVLGSISFLVVGTLVQLPRQAGMEMWRTVWAEDGKRFYADALARPWRTNVLESYAGYAHVVPRTLASIGTALPVEWYSRWVTVSAAFITALLALFIYLASAPLLRSRVRQAILAGALLLWPTLPFEVTGTITNIQWMLPVACLLAVLLPVDRPGPIAARIPVVVLAPLSSPLCVLFAPIAAWHLVRFVRGRTRWGQAVIPSLYLFAATIQLVVFSTAPQLQSERMPIGAFGRELGKLYSTKVSLELLFGVDVTRSVWDALGWFAAIASLVLIAVVLVWRFVVASPTTRVLIAGCVGGSVFTYAASLYPRSENLAAIVPIGGQAYNFISMRYGLFPAALLLLALLVPIDLDRSAMIQPGAPAPPRLVDDLRSHRLAIVVALVWVCVAFVPSYRFTTGRSEGPDWIEGVARAHQACGAADEPAQVVQISPPTWFVTIACRNL